MRYTTTITGKEQEVEKALREFRDKFPGRILSEHKVPYTVAVLTLDRPAPKAPAATDGLPELEPQEVDYEWPVHVIEGDNGVYELLNDTR